MARIDESSRSLAVVDWVIIAAYFVLCLGVGLFVSTVVVQLETHSQLKYFAFLLNRL